MRRTVLAGALALAILAPACGGNDVVERAEARAVDALDADGLPGEILGLKVGREDITALVEDTDRPYFDAVGLYSLREGDTLQATLQIGRFADDADYDDPEFQQKVLTTSGAGSVRELRLAERAAYLSSADRQQVAIWFDGPFMLILSIREEYETPRSLLRKAMELHP